MDNNQISDFSLKGEEPEFWTYKSLDDCKYFPCYKSKNAKFKFDNNTKNSILAQYKLNPKKFPLKKHHAFEIPRIIKCIK